MSVKIRDRIVELRRVPARELIQHPKNFRRHPPAQQAALRGGVDEIGYADALIARETDAGLELIDGHLRAETTPDAVVPVLVLDVTEAEADKLLATLDPLSALAETDQDALDKLLEGVETDSDALRSLLDELGKRNGNDWREREDSVPDLSEEPTTKPGDLWILGHHRLLCGDATDADDVRRVMDGKRASLFHTDPPYLVDYVGSDRPSHGKDWSDVYREVDIADAEAFFRGVFSAAGDVLDADAAWYCWHAHKRAALIESVWAELGVLNHQQIIWCLSGGARVYARTQKGEAPMRIIDLVKLRPETVRLWTGQRWTRVLGWSRSTSEAGLEIELRSGERIGCTPHHLWPTERGLIRADALEPGDVMLTTRLPEPTEPDRPRGLPDEEVGWLVGLYLAEGTLSNNGLGFTISCHADEVDLWAKQIGELVLDLSGSLTKRTYGNEGIISVRSQVLAAVIRTYVTPGRQDTRHLRSSCWKRSDAFLHALLSGYLEGDGHWEGVSGQWRLGFAHNKRLVENLRTLSARLGIGLRLKPARVVVNDNSHAIFRGQVRFERSGHHNEKADSEVIRIRSSKTRSFWHIGVADDAHVFALASGTLTGNSKPSILHGYAYYPWQHEPCLMGWRKGHKPKHDGKNTAEVTSVWELDWEGKARVVGNQHPTQKPVELFAIPMRKHTKRGDICYEPFSGSGSQIIAAEREGRRCFAIEIEPRFVDVAVARWQELTGKAAERTTEHGKTRTETEANQPARPARRSRRSDQPVGAGRADEGTALSGNAVS